jgi:hypothetical protein
VVEQLGAGAKVRDRLDSDHAQLIACADPGQTSVFVRIVRLGPCATGRR